jgi:50S ribosomal protein L16 3-hydroxylase
MAKNAFPVEVNGTVKQPLGMSSTDFLRDYWQQRPLLVRQAFPNFQCPITPDDLAGLALEEAAISRLVQYHRAKDHWQIETGPFAEDRFADLPERDWTLLVQDVDKWDADVAALYPAFSFLPRWRFDDIMISYAVPGGSVGPHVDNYDVFLIQGWGERNWKIDNRANPPLDFLPDVALKLLRQFDPSHDWVLAPGDMLYLPPGVPHHGVGVTECLTISVGLRAPSSAELIGDLADHLCPEMPEELRYVDPGLAAAKHAGEIDAAAIQRLRVALSPVLTMDDAALQRWFGSFVTRYRAAVLPTPPPKLPSRTHMARKLDEGASAVPHPYSRRAWTRVGRAADLHSCGETYRVSLKAAPLFCADLGVDAKIWAQFSCSDKEVLLDLLLAGHFLLRPARKVRR